MNDDDKFFMTVLVLVVVTFSALIIMLGALGTHSSNEVHSKCVGHETRAFTTNKGISTQYDPKCK